MGAETSAKAVRGWEDRTVGSIQSAVRNVFSGRVPDLVGRQPNPKPWPLFQLVPSSAKERRGAGLTSIVEGEIIPRLCVAHGSSPVETRAPPEARRDDDVIVPAELMETCARLSLARRTDLLETFFSDFVLLNGSARAIYAGLLAPTARLLIDLWDNDRISYTEVTIALGRLQHLVHELRDLTPYNGDDDPRSRSAFFAPRPGEQQTFGFFVIEEQFRWSGWRTWIETSATSTELSAGVRCQWFDLFCLSVSRDAHMEDVCDTIRDVRRASRNRDLFVLVSGSPFLEHPGLVDFVGADAAAANGGEALEIMSHTPRRHAA